jgi:hypothetical protein
MRTMTDLELLALRTSMPGSKESMVWDEEDPRNAELMRVHEELAAIGLVSMETDHEVDEDDGARRARATATAHGASCIVIARRLAQWILELFAATFVHEYTSTACMHDEHRVCRRTCKFCSALCGCPCHRLH